MYQGVFQTSDDCSIAYTLRAARTPGLPRVVLVHSLALDGSIWDGVAARLAIHADILTYDCRGHGRSGRRSEGFTMARFARDLEELLDHLDWPAVVLAGCSMGGCVAQAFGGLYGARARALALIDTTAWYGEEASAAWHERANAVRSKGLVGLVDFQIKRWFSDNFCVSHPEVVKATTEVFLDNDLDCYASSCILLGEADLRPHLKSIHCPVSIIVGEEDYATPVSASEQLHQAIHDSTLTIIPGVRHLTPIECPEVIATELVKLLERI